MAGMFKEVEVIHLLKGHTHNDVDAIFGVMARSVANDTILTLEELVEKLKASVKTSKILCPLPVRLSQTFKLCPS